MTDYTVAVLEDAIGLLQLLGDHPNGMSLAQITESSGFVKNKVFRILFTLEKHGMVERDEQGLYHLGFQLMELGHRVYNKTLLLEASRPLMDRLVVETGESIFLGVVSGKSALCVAARESPRSIRLFAQVGRRAPLHSGGVPKVLFANLPDSDQQELIDYYCDNPDFGAKRSALQRTLQTIREQNFAIVVDELDPGAHSIAAPIRDYTGQVIAALSIAGPSSRFNDQIINDYVILVCDAASEISSALGYEERDFSQVIKKHHESISQ